MKKKKLLTLTMLSVMSVAAAMMTGCGGNKSTSQSGSVQTESTISSDAGKNTSTESGSGNSILKNIDGQTFYYSSGAGAWATELKVYADGSFEGHYYDMNMGESGAKYPDGTQYDSQFKGSFSTPEKVNDYSYTFKVEKFETDKKAGTEEIKNKIRYVYSDPAGLSDGATIYLYTKGAPVSSLPKGYLSWADSTINGADSLSFYGIYNETDDAGYVSGQKDISSEKNTEKTSAATSSKASDIQKELAQIDEEAAAIEARLQNENLTQNQMNQLTAQIYKLWDDKLNEMWSYLSNTLDSSTMKTLKEEERVWINKKESQIKEAGKEAAGGSMQAMLENDKAAELTKDRVYELAKYYK